VQQLGEVCLPVQLCGGLGHAVEQALRQVDRGRERLGEGEVCATADDDVSESPTVVNIDQTLHDCPFSFGCEASWLSGGLQAAAADANSAGSPMGVTCPIFGQGS